MRRIAKHLGRVLHRGTKVMNLPSPKGMNIGIGFVSSPRESFYSFNDAFGDKWDNPGTLPTGGVNGITWNNDSTLVALAHQTSPFVSVYDWSNATGFGSKYTNPGTLPAGIGNSVAWSPDNAFLAVTHLTTPFISVYPWSNGFGTKVTDPTGLPAGTQGQDAKWSPDGLYIGMANNVGGGGDKQVNCWNWSSAGFGAKVTSPTPLPTAANTIEWSPDNSYVAVGGTTSPFIYVYPWNGSFGAQVANPGTLPSNQAHVAWSPDGLSIAASSLGSVFIYAYPWTNGAFGTKYTDPSTLPAGAGSRVRFSPDSRFIAVSHTNSPFLTVYSWISGTGFNGKLDDPAVLPLSDGGGLGWSGIK